MVPYIQVNANGHISFLAPVSDFVPERFPLERSLPLIAPFWADSDTQPEDGGHIWYRNSTDFDILSSVAEIIHSNFLAVDSFDPDFLFIVTWDHIGYYSRHTDRVHYILLGSIFNMHDIVYSFINSINAWLRFDI